MEARIALCVLTLSPVYPMIIVHGTKRTEKKLGFVADFCPICRGVRAFQLLRIGMVSHLYFISFGGGKLAGHQIACEQCKQRFSTDPLRYVTFQQTHHASSDAESLVQNTFPKLREVYAPRLAVEEKIHRSPARLTSEERADLIIEPFRLLNPGVETRFTGDTKFDKKSGFGCLGTLVGGIALFGIGAAVNDTLKDYVLAGAMALVVIGTLYTFIQLALGPGRFMRKEVVPALANTLEPLKPTQEELNGSLDKCKAAGMKLGQKLKPQQLWKELERRAAGVSV